MTTMTTHIAQTKRTISVFDHISLNWSRRTGRKSKVIGILASIMYITSIRKEGFW